MLCNCDLWLCWFAIAVKSQRHTTRCLYSSDGGANGVDKSRFRVGWVWWRSSQWVKCVTSATCMLVMGFRQAVASHLEEGIFLNETLWWVWAWDGSVWCRDCLLIFSYLKQGRWQTPNPTYWTYVSLWEKKGQGVWHCDAPGALVTIFPFLFTGWPHPHRILNVTGNWSMKGWMYKDMYGWVLGVRYISFDRKCLNAMGVCQMMEL